MEVEQPKYGRYRRRFLYLAVVVVLNVSNAMCWITYAPITFQTNAYYGYENAATFFNVVFMALSVPAGVVAVWGCDRFGLRGGVLIGGTFNLIGNIIRFGGSLSAVPLGWRFPISFTGQIFASVAQPFIMFLTTKVTAFWFPQDQRVAANTIASMSNPLGIAAMYSLSPVIVNNDYPENFVLLTGITAALSVVAGVLSLTVTSSEPPIPVSASKANDKAPPPPFWQGVKRSLRSRNFVILACCLGGGVGLFNALYNNLQPALCAKGYSPTFCGLMGSWLILAGLAGAAVAGVVADYTGKNELIFKCSFLLAGFSAASLAVSVDFSDVEWWIATSIGLFGFFGFAIYPLGLETGVEVTYPVAEATSTGLIIIAGQIEGVLFVIITSLVNTAALPEDLARQTCSQRTSEITNVVGWKYSFLVWAGFVSLLCLIAFVFFRPKLRRRAVDEGAATGSPKLRSLSETAALMRRTAETEE